MCYGIMFACKLQGGGLYEVIVECDGLFLINSTGHQYLRVRKVSYYTFPTNQPYYISKVDKQPMSVLT